MSHLSQKETQERVERIATAAMVGLLANNNGQLLHPLSREQIAKVTKVSIELAIKMTFELNAVFE